VITLCGFCAASISEGQRCTCRVHTIEVSLTGFVSVRQPGEKRRGLPGAVVATAETLGEAQATVRRFARASRDGDGWVIDRPHWGGTPSEIADLAYYLRHGHHVRELAS
jgi:hypothetical protein